MKKRWISLFLCLVVLAGLLPAFQQAKAAYYDYSKLDCTAWGANYLYAPYMNRAMEYRIENNGELRSALDAGQTIVFAFEGGSAAASPAYNDPYHPVRVAALLLVVRLVGGRPAVVYANDECNTFPDVPTEYSNNYVNPITGSPFSSYKCFQNGWGAGTLKDGVYPYEKDTYYLGEVSLYLYKSRTRSIYVAPKTAAGYVDDASDGIFVHYGMVRERSTEPNTRRYSMGCINVGTELWEIKELVSNCSTYGCVVVDRQLYTREMVEIWSNNGNTKARAAVNAIKAESDAVAAAIATMEPQSVTLTPSAAQQRAGQPVTWTASSIGGDAYWLTVYNEETGAVISGPARMSGSSATITIVRPGLYRGTLTAINPAGYSVAESETVFMYRYGDVNGDGWTDLEDVSCLFRMKTGELEADEAALERGGVDGFEALSLRNVADLYSLCAEA